MESTGYYHNLCLEVNLDKCFEQAIYIVTYYEKQ